MSGCRHIFKRLLPGLLLVLCVRVGAQEAALARAQQLYNGKKTEEAMKVIDSVVVHPDTRGDFISWTLRAFIYYDLYKRTDRMKLHSSLRDSIVSSLGNSQKLNPDSTIRQNNRNLYVSLAQGYYNVCKALLMDSINYERSSEAYSKYKELYAIAEPTTNFTNKDVEYNLAVGSVYSDVVSKDYSNTRALDIVKVSLLKILDVQPDQPNALMNLGLLYYNQAVNLSKSLDYGADLAEIDFVQENMVKLARQAEQFIVRVYNNDNNHPKAVEALYYIYRMLSEFQKSEEFKAKCKNLGINVEPSSANSK